MSEGGTTPFARLRTLATRSVRATVEEGPDAGRSASGERLTIGTAETNSFVLTDATVSRFHVELEAQPAGILVSDHGSTNGTLVAGVRLGRGFVTDGAVLRLGSTSVRVAAAGTAQADLHPRAELAGIIGASPAMRRLMAQVERLAPTAVAVLVQGESGTGKERVAEALHALGPRGRSPFVTVDCGALSPSLVTSELFGHEKGAFTGATDRHVGAFERAHGGTLFLDEIGELPESLQVSLLGALERRRVRRVGGKTDVEVDVRVIAATHRDLRADVNAGRFRLDLYYRLAVVVLEVPPLRQRPEDVLVLADHFVRESGAGRSAADVFGRDTLAALERHAWPGNARELRNFVEAALALGAAPELGPASAPTSATDVVAQVIERPWAQARNSVLADFERRYLEALIGRTGDNLSEASRVARLDRAHLRELLRKHGLRGG